MMDLFGLSFLLRILLYLQLYNSDDEDQQVLDFLAAVDQNFQNSIIPGSYVTLDENMVKSFHQNLKGKIKIIREPCPVGNEMKNMANSASEIVLNLELYEGSDTMSQKDYVKSHGATAATNYK